MSKVLRFTWGHSRLPTMCEMACSPSRTIMRLCSFGKFSCLCVLFTCYLWYTPMLSSFQHLKAPTCWIWIYLTWVTPSDSIKKRHLLTEICFFFWKLISLKECEPLCDSFFFFTLYSLHLNPSCSCSQTAVWAHVIKLKMKTFLHSRHFNLLNIGVIHN